MRMLMDLDAFSLSMFLIKLAFCKSGDFIQQGVICNFLLKSDINLVGVGYIYVNESFS